MKTIDKDRNSLKRLVEAYGKEDVMKYVNHLDEYMLGGNDWGEHTYQDNHYRKYGLANEDEIPYYAMSALWFLGFFADKFITILSNNLDPKTDKNPDVRGMDIQEIEYWDKVLDPIAGLMSNKTNIKGDDHQITKQDLLQYSNIYEKLLKSPVYLLKSSAQQLINFCKEISNSRRVGESVKTDRNKLKALVEAYGKEDVMKFVKHINESIDESQAKKAAITKAYNEIDFEQDSPDDLMRILEELYDAAADEGYQLGYDEGYNQGYNDCDCGDEYEK